MRALAAAAAAALMVAACSSGADEETPDTAESTSTSSSATSPSTTVPTFSGDPGSEFCGLIAQSEARPVLDPFEADVDPTEVELRMRNLRNRFGDYLDVAPAELEADLEVLVVALEDTDDALAEFGYDFEAMADAGYTIGTLDDPVFEVVGFRLEQYRRQVCEPG